MDKISTAKCNATLKGRQERKRLGKGKTEGKIHIKERTGVVGMVRVRSTEKLQERVTEGEGGNTGGKISWRRIK